jgi:hypothetical protein
MGRHPAGFWFRIRSGRGYHPAVPSWSEIAVGFVLALGFLAVAIAFSATPPPWSW